MDYSLPGSSICGIFQARVLEWGAIAFSTIILCINKKEKKNMGNENINVYIIGIMEKTMASHSSTLAWKIPQMEEPGRLQSMGSLKVRYD